MDIFKASIEMNTRLLKSLTPQSVTVLEANGSVGTIKIVSDAFEDLPVFKRLEKVVSVLDAGNPEILKQLNLAFVLVTTEEDSEWIDYKELNKNSGDRESLNEQDL